MSASILHQYASEIVYAVPIAMLFTAVWFLVQKKRDKETKISNNFVFKNALFVGILVGVLMYIGKPLPLIEEKMHVGPPDF